MNSQSRWNPNPKNLKIAYIGGGSRGWARGLMADLALETEIAGRVSLFDLDTQAAQDNATLGNALSKRPEAPGKWAWTVEPTLEAALTGADFVFASILPGDFDAMESDVHAPEAYGIYQSVGDTVGPGGLLRALRTIPLYVEIAKAVEKCCPQAWVINYTNPMTLCVRTLYETFPAIKAFGCCHEVFGTQKLLAHMLGDLKGLKGVDRRDIKVNVLGINHFTWFDQASYKDLDLMPPYREFALKYKDTGFDDKDEGHWANNTFASANRVKFDLFLRYGLIAAAGDRHLAEFTPPWYLKDPETVKNWMFGLTTVAWRRKDLEAKRQKTADLLSGKIQLELKPSGEEGLVQVKALLGLCDVVTNINTPNRGQTKGLPFGSVVETNCVLTRDSVRPAIAGGLPPAIQALVDRHVNNQETILQAALKRDKELAFHAFVQDPLVRIDRDDARKLFETMLNNTRKWLPGWNL